MSEPTRLKIKGARRSCFALIAASSEGLQHLEWHNPIFACAFHSMEQLNADIQWKRRGTERLKHWWSFAAVHSVPSPDGSQTTCTCHVWCGLHANMMCLWPQLCNSHYILQLCSPIWQWRHSRQLCKFTAQFTYQSCNCMLFIAKYRGGSSHSNACGVGKHIHDPGRLEGNCRVMRTSTHIDGWRNNILIWYYCRKHKGHCSVFSFAEVCWICGCHQKLGCGFLVNLSDSDLLNAVSYFNRHTKQYLIVKLSLPLCGRS